MASPSESRRFVVLTRVLAVAVLAAVAVFVVVISTGSSESTTSSTSGSAPSSTSDMSLPTTVATYRDLVQYVGWALAHLDRCDPSPDSGCGDAMGAVVTAAGSYESLHTPANDGTWWHLRAEGDAIISMVGMYETMRCGYGHLDSATGTGAGTCDTHLETIRDQLTKFGERAAEACLNEEAQPRSVCSNGFG